MRRQRLVSKRLMIGLTIAPLWALWELTNLDRQFWAVVEQSRSPTTAIAFFSFLHHRNPDSALIALHLARSHFRAGDAESAVDLIGRFLSDDLLEQLDGSLRGDIAVLYGRALLASSRRGDEPITDAMSEAAYVRLKALAYKPLDDIEYSAARVLADISLQLSLPDRALFFLWPFRGSDSVPDRELIDLALQAGNSKSAIGLLNESLPQNDSLDDIRQLLSLYEQDSGVQEAVDFLRGYSGRWRDSAEIHSLSVRYGNMIGDQQWVLASCERLVRLNPSFENLVQAGEAALAANNLSASEHYFERALQLRNAPDVIVRLHEIYLWNGEVGKALQASVNLWGLGATKQQLRAGILEARAVADLEAESRFYSALSAIDPLTSAEISAWVNAAEKGLGVERTIHELEHYTGNRGANKEVTSHLVRFYSYQGMHAKVAASGRNLMAMGEYSAEDARRLARSHLALGQPDRALDALLNAVDWMQQDEDYLGLVEDLAWQLGKQGLLREIFSHQLEQGSGNISSYRIIALAGRQPGAATKDLVRLYDLTGEVRALLQAADEAEQSESQEVRDLVATAIQQAPADGRSPELPHLQIRQAIDAGDTEKADAYFQQLLANFPAYVPGMVDYFWWVIDQGDMVRLADLYTDYRGQWVDDSSTWPLMAASADLLGREDEARQWYLRVLRNSGEPDNSVLLNYARLAERTGDSDTAYRVRLWVINRIRDNRDAGPSEQLQTVQAQLLGPDFSRELAQHRALHTPDKGNIKAYYDGLLSSGRSDVLHFWHQRQAWQQYNDDTRLQLALAVAAEDRDRVGQLLTMTELAPVARNAALQASGNLELAWQEGSEQLGSLSNEWDNAQLRRQLAWLHPYRVHGLRTQYRSNVEWDIDTASVDYFAPLSFGALQIGSDYQTARMPAQFGRQEDEEEQRLRINMRGMTPDAVWSLGVNLANGIGDQRLGFSAGGQYRLSPYFTAGINLELNSETDASRMLAIAGQLDQLQFTGVLQADTRNVIEASASAQNFDTRFDDEIGSGWQLNLIGRHYLYNNTSAWSLYAGYQHQRIDYANENLSGINQWINSDTPLVAADFILPNFRRVAIGQRLERGLPGTPGATVPAPRYWLDASAGYNFSLSQTDYTASAGIGWTLTGNDELYMSSSWQSSDRTGEGSLLFNFGYFYGF